VREVYWKLVRNSSEMDVLLNVEYQDLAAVDEKIAGVILKNREGMIDVVAGYDGVYGVPVIDSSKITKTMITKTQKQLDEFVN
jgi:PHP family Zn ribbon phosphoesterase